MEISRRSGGRLLKEDLKYKSLKIREVPSVGTSANKRINNTRKLLNWMKNGNNSNKLKIFSDEKLFVIDAKFHRQNDQYLSKVPMKLVEPRVKYNSMCKHPAKVMVLGIIVSDGKKCDPIFIDQTICMDSNMYQNLLRSYFLQEAMLQALMYSSRTAPASPQSNS